MRGPAALPAPAAAAAAAALPPRGALLKVLSAYLSDRVDETQTFDECFVRDCSDSLSAYLVIFTFQCRIFRPLASPFSINRNCQNHEILLLKDSSLLLVYSFARRRQFFVRGCFDSLPAHSQLTKIRYGIFPTHCFFRRIASSFTFEV